MKTEVRRGRKFVEYIDDSLPVGTFVQEIGAHDVSYQETGGSWLPVNESWETDGQDGFSFRAHRMNHKVRFDSIGAWRWYPRRNVETEYIVINRPQCWLTATKRWGNLLVNGISREGRDITLTSVRKVTRVIHSRWNGIKTDWILLDSTAPTKFRQQIELVGLTELDGWLYGADGEKVALLTPTTAIGADGAELPCSGTYADGYLQFEADVTGAVYPVTIDPDFAGDTADAYIMSIEDASYAIAQATSGTLYNNEFLNIGSRYFRSKWVIRRSFLKFDTSSIADTATIAQVNLKLTCASDDSTNDFDVQIVKQDWSSQDPLASGNQEAAFDGCLTADADDSVWRNTNGISTNTTYTSGNLSTAWVNKTGATYYSMRSSLDYSGTASAGNVDLCSSSHLTTSYRPVLIVTYEAGGQSLTLTCAAGSYSLTGTAATLTYTGSAQNLTLSCGAGSLALTGSTATFEVKRNYVLSCSAGSYALAGVACTLTALHNYVLAAESPAYPDIVVSGAGTSAANGTYSFLVMLESKPVYTKGDDYNIWWDSAYHYWTIYHASIGDYYTSTEDVATPDLVTTWTIGAEGSAPVPTVSPAITYTLTGSPVTLTVQRNYTLACGAGSYALTGSAVSFEVKRNYTLACAAGSYALTGTNATFTVTRNYTMACNAGSYTLTGAAATFAITRAYTLTASAGSYTLTGSAISFGNTKAYSLALDAGSYALTGSGATFTVLRNYTLALGVGSYALTGTDADLLAQYHYTLACASGSYALTGTDVTLDPTLHYTLACSAGSYALTGTSVTLEVKHNFTIACDAGSYTLTGTDVSFGNTIAYSLACNSGAYLLTGTPTSLTSARSLACNSGAYTLTGLEADLFKRLVMPCGNGSYILTGSPATINSARTFVLGMGSYVLVGTDAGLYKYVQFPYAEIWDGEVVMNLGISENIRLNKEVNKSAVMNRELDFTYSELESTL